MYKGVHSMYRRRSMTGDTMLSALGEGPARLAPAEVAASQRRRMLAAMVAAVAEKGYVNVAVGDVVSRARVSRATFYGQFTDKTDCFIAAFHACVDGIVGTLRTKAPRSLSPRQRLRRLLESYLGELAAFPEGARVCLVEIYAAGPEAALHRQQIQLDFVALLRTMHAGFVAAGEADDRHLTDFDFEALVGAISSLATNRVAAGDAAHLPDLLAPLEAFVLTHFGATPGTADI
jgi:AcrR family transcriptional regulator